MPKIKIYCNNVKCIDTRKVLSITDGEINPISPNTLITLNALEVVITEKLQQHDAGNFVSQSLQFTVKEPDVSINQLLLPGYVFQINRSDGGKIIFGSTDKPAYLNLGDSNINHLKMSFTRKVLQYEFVNTGIGVTEPS